MSEAIGINYPEDVRAQASNPAPATPTLPLVADPAIPQNASPPPVDYETANWSQNYWAGWRAGHIRTDAWEHTETLKSAIFTDMYNRLSREQRDNADAAARAIATGPGFENTILSEAAISAQADPEAWAGLPLTAEAIEAQVLEARRQELAEADAVLDMPGGGVPAFLGGISRAATDQRSLLMLPFGLEGGVLRVMVGEIGLGVLGEAAVLPSERQVARELGEPEPDTFTRLATGGLLGGVFAGVITGAQRGMRYAAGKAQAAEEALPAGVDPLDQRSEVQGEVDRMMGQESPTQSLERTNAGRATDRHPDQVELRFDLDGKIRDHPLSDDFTHRLRSIVAPLGDDINVVITSGGQDRIGTSGARRTGSTRHDVDGSGHANTADLVLTRNGRVVLPNEDKELYARFFHLAAAQFPGLGHYSWGVHVGGGSVAAWGPTTRAASLDPYFKAAIDAGRVGWEGWTPAARPRGQFPNEGPPSATYTTSRGYTGTGQVTAGDDFNIDVKYEVVDASLLRQAEGDLQPRDRARAASDEQVAEIAARLDPARLMPSPEADRGAPIVGPDNRIESGNGRVLAIQRAAERHPDRIDAYRQQIEAAGFPIPPGTEIPVLIARRTTEMDLPARQAFVRQANSSAVARMSATERATSDARAMDADTVGLFDPAQPLSSKANKAFVQRSLASLPQAERNALVDAKGALNAEGMSRIRQALFARAYDAPDILARFTETGAGPLRSLLDALEEAAPAWATMRAGVAAGRIRPEMDITENLMDAVRLIANARQIAAREGTIAAEVIKDLLADVDLLEGALSPLTVALVRKLAPDGKAAAKGKVASFLTRYANEAGKVGTTDASLFGDGPGPAQILRAIDEKTFGDLPDDIRPTERVPTASPADQGNLEVMPEHAFADGAHSPDAIAADNQLATTFRAGTSEQKSLRPVDHLESSQRGQPTATIEQPARSEIEAFIARGDDLTFDQPDGSAISLREILDDLDADTDLDDIISLCSTKGTA